LIEEFRLQPILAVIPDNQDSKLELSPPDPEFWTKMRKLEAAGATIALHGYHHLCKSRGDALLPLHHMTEFAGVAEETQRQWIRTGLGILRSQGLNPKIWVAPRHGFDTATLNALRKEGVRLLSDGFARVPCLRGGITWIPQQLWGPVEKSKGLWTICIHSNSAHSSELDRLRAFLRQHASQFTSVDRVLTELSPAKLDFGERLYAAWMQLRARASRARKRRAYRTHRASNH
jgi:predicted deacetylase